MSLLSGSDIESYDLPDEGEYQCNYLNKMMSVHTYQCTFAPRRDVLCNKPISFLKLQDNEFAISVSFNIYLKLTIESYVKNVCGLHYFQWKMDENINEGELQIKMSCIFLPLLSNGGIFRDTPNNDRGFYTAVAHDYTEIDRGGNFTKLRLQKDDLV